MRKTILALAAAALLGTGCATQTASRPADAEQATAAIAAAEARKAEAAAVGYEWRDTAKMLDEARKAATEKDYSTAVRLAQQAERQGKDAAAQYRLQAESVKTRM